MILRSKPKPRSEIWVHTVTNLGSTKTAIPIYDTTIKNIGSAITKASTAADGDSYTINEDGVYSIEIGGVRSAGVLTMAISKNTADYTGTTSLAGGVSLGIQQLGTAIYGSKAAVTILAVGDVIRPHYSAAPNTANQHVYFRIVKLSD